MVEMTNRLWVWHGELFGPRVDKTVNASVDFRGVTLYQVWVAAFQVSS